MFARVPDELQLVAKSQAANIRQVISLFTFVLNQSALAAYVFAIWRVGVDLGVTGQFFIAEGLFSHWQVWLASAITLQVAASSLNHWLAQRRD